MERVTVVFFIFAMLVGMVCADGNWGEINSEENSESDEILEDRNVSSDVLVSLDNVNEQDYEPEELQFSEEGKEYTRDFYIALGVGVLGLLIVGLFIYLFIRDPKNKWKK